MAANRRATGRVSKPSARAIEELFGPATPPSRTRNRRMVSFADRLPPFELNTRTDNPVARGEEPPSDGFRDIDLNNRPTVLGRQKTILSKPPRDSNNKPVS